MSAATASRLPPRLAGRQDVGHRLLPCLGYAIYTHGLARMLPILLVSYGVGLGVEVIFAILRKKPVSEGYLVTGMLVALIVPITIPLWQLAVGVAFAVVFAKEAFGGTGKNIFNPALVCRAFLFFAYPAQLSGDVWVPSPVISAEVAAVSAATPLAVAASSGPAASDAMLDRAGYTARALVIGDVPGTPGETSKLAVLVGALVLIGAGVASLRIMIGGVVGLLGMAMLIGLAMPDAAGIAGLAPWRHLVIAASCSRSCSWRPIP